MELEKQVTEKFDSIEKALQASVEKVKSDLQVAINKANEAVEKNPDTLRKIVAEETKSINESLQALAQWQKERQPIEAADRQAIDNMLSELKGIRKNTYRGEAKTFGDAFREAMADKHNLEGISQVRKNNSFTIELKDVRDMSLKAVGNMTLGANLTGDSVVSYSQTQALLPKPEANFRDLMRTVYSDTGTYVHFRESAGEGSIGQQTEGNSKAQIDFDFTEVKTVNKYYSGFTRFSKQLAKSLPFFQGTLPELLLREFFNEENDQFKSVVAAAATGAWSTAETDDVKKIIDYISGQRTRKFKASYGLISHNQKAALDKLTYVNGYYQTSGGVVSGVNGTTLISNVPLIPVSWMNDDKILIVDDTYLERIECDGLRVEFFEQDGDNVTKNLITARIECYEEVNPMMGASLIYANL